MFLKQKPSFRELVLSFLSIICLCGLLALSYIDNESKQAFTQLATFVTGGTVGFFLPVEKR